MVEIVHMICRVFALVIIVASIVNGRSFSPPVAEARLHRGTKFDPKYESGPAAGGALLVE